MAPSTIRQKKKKKSSQTHKTWLEPASCQHSKHWNKHMCSIHENMHRLSLICPLPAAVTLLPLCAFNFHLPPSFALSPIYFGSPLLPCLRLSHKWPSVVISFVLFLVGWYRTIAVHHWSLIAFLWFGINVMQKNLFFFFLLPFPSGINEEIILRSMLMSS